MSLRKQATSGLVWTFAQQFGNQIIGFGVSLVLARILLPEEFGLIGMISIFIGIGNTLLNSGLTQSLIRSKELDQEDYSTVFYFNLVASIFMYGLVFILSPYIADFYERDILEGIVKLYSLTFIISAFSAVQLSRLTKNMDFKTQTLIAIPSTIVGGIVGIVMAYKGYGVWSLVWSHLVTASGSSIQLWIYSKWTPGFIFNIAKFKDHFGFGYKLTLSGLLDTIFKNIYLIVIGKYFSAAQVGFYTRAETMKQLPVTNLSNALNKVTYPMFAEIQDDNVRLKRVYKQLMQMVVFVIAPTLIFLAVLAEPTFRFLFTEKWLPAVPYFQILCATGILYPIHAYNLNVLKVKGRSDLFLRLAIFKKIAIVIIIAMVLPFGIYALLYGRVFLSIFNFFINSYYSGRFIKYTSTQQIKDILPILFIAIISGTCVYGVDIVLKSYNQFDIIRISAGALLGIISYAGISYFIKLEVYFHIMKLIKRT